MILYFQLHIFFSFIVFIVSSFKYINPNLSVISSKRIFTIVADALRSLARLTGFTYNEINVLLYYFFIPFTWLILLDIILHIHYLKIAGFIFCLGFFAGCKDFKEYSDWLFFKSVIFLNFFNRFGSNYIKSSVWICVSVPIFIYAILFYLTF